MRKIAVEILQSVNNRTQSLLEMLHMVIIHIIINILLGGLTLDPAGMHCPAWDDAFVSSYRQETRTGKLPVLFLLSSQKSTFCPLAEKL